MKEEKILFQFENMPMIVVCKNDNEERFLFLCTDPIWDMTWMITKNSNKYVDQSYRKQNQCIRFF